MTLIHTLFDNSGFTYEILRGLRTLGGWILKLYPGRFTFAVLLFVIEETLF